MKISLWTSECLFLSCQRFNKWNFPTFSFWDCQASIYFPFKKVATCNKLQNVFFTLSLVVKGILSQSTELCHCPQSLIWGRKWEKKTSTLSHNCLAMGTELYHCPQSLIWGKRYTATLSHNCLTMGTANGVALFVGSRATYVLKCTFE